ncbi:11600_t:CDS:1 [Paraglomus brasilianum]|uniref:11600_t:CDS:1 n=1 Tax=Paraglomus brasilianum TaxID=144538 RepID=A0A9N9AHW5_9GLOM|nr:11600_t:CDS:1 [Paraglomus brasilianum]
MAKLNPLCTVLVTIIEGRYFPETPDSKLYIECRFTDEILSTITPDSNSILCTDTVEQTGCPIWDTELAWEVDQKTLNLLKSQWANLKLQCFSLNSMGRSELIGYSMLDLRAAAYRPGKDTWISLLNPSDRGLCPEVRVGFCILTNLSTDSTSIEDSIEGTVVNGISNISKHPNIKRIDTGTYRIGAEPDDIFILSITINFGANLHLLIPNSASFLSDKLNTDSDTSAMNSALYFQYTFLESVIKGSKFHDLFHPTMKPETATFRFHSTLVDFQSFLIRESKLVVNLYQETKLIGFAEIPLTGLFDAKTGDPRSLDRVCPIYNTKKELSMSPDAQTPRIGIFFAVRIDDTNAILDNLRSVDSPKQDKDKSRTDNNDQSLLVEHEYRVHIDLKTIKLVKTFRDIFIRYSYPALGITNSKTTQDLPNVEEGIDQSISNGTTAIDVKITPLRLQRYFETVPLLMDICQHLESKDVQIGIVSLTLAEVFQADSTRDDETNVEMITYSTRAPIKSVGVATIPELGHINVTIRIEDYGARESAVRQNSTSIFPRPLSEGSPQLDAEQEYEISTDPGRVSRLSNNSGMGDYPTRSAHNSFRSEIFQQAEEYMRFNQEVLRSKKDVSPQGIYRNRVQQLRAIDHQLQQSVLYFRTRDESLKRAEKDIEARWLELDRQFEQKTREMKQALEREYQEKERKLKQTTPGSEEKIRLLQDEVESLRNELEYSKRAAQQYESQWLRALEIVAGMDSNAEEIDELYVTGGIENVGDNWMQVKKLAEEELKYMDNDRLALENLKKELDKLRAVC